jgi:hypothetical protein
MLEAVSDVFPLPLDAYPSVPGQSLFNVLAARLEVEPFNLVAALIFLFAILHTFAAARFTALAHRLQHQDEERARAAGRPVVPRFTTELLHFFGEVEVVFGLWGVVLVIALAAGKGWHTVTHYLNDTVVYTEAMFVVVIMALASSRPVVTFAEAMLRRVANAGGGTPAAWWFTILTLGPLLGSFITEPAAMTICALLLARQFFDLHPGTRLKYATLGALFVNVSIGGTLTQFAAPPVLIVAERWNWDLPYMFTRFGWRAAVAVLLSTSAYWFVFRRELRALASRPAVADVDQPDEEAVGPALLPIPAWITAVHLLFIAWTVFVAHYPALFVGGFLFFIGFARATASYQSQLALRTPLLVGFFLAGLVIHGGLQGWWIAPVLSSLSETPLFVASAVLTSFNDNALITFLATLVPGLDEQLRLAVVQGAVVGGGLTVIANAPNPAGQALLARFFGGAVMPLRLLAGAIPATLIAALAFRLL